MLQPVVCTCVLCECVCVCGCMCMCTCVLCVCVCGVCVWVFMCMCTCVLCEWVCVVHLWHSRPEVFYKMLQIMCVLQMGDGLSFPHFDLWLLASCLFCSANSLLSVLCFFFIWASRSIPALASASLLRSHSSSWRLSSISLRWRGRRCG